MSYIGNIPVLQTTEFREEQTITTESQDLFTTQGYQPGYISVFRNGVRLAEEDYLASDGYSVLLNTPAVKDDIMLFEYRTEVVQILDNTIGPEKLSLTSNSLPIDVIDVADASIPISALALTANGIPVAVVNVVANSIPVSAIDGLIDIDKINITANSISLDSIALTENGIPISAVNTAGLNLDAGAKADMFYENSNILTESYTITDGKNALSAGPITIADGVVVTVPANSVWTVV